MSKWTIEFVGDKDNDAWAVVSPDEERHDQYRYSDRRKARYAAEILNRHAPGQEYATVCFAVRIDPITRRQLFILEDGEIELTSESFSTLTELAINGNGVFSIAEIGCPSWAERAGADPSLWED